MSGFGSVARFYAPTKIVHGVGAVRQLPVEAKALGISRALIVTDRGVRGVGLVDEPVKLLEDAGIPVTVFDEVEQDPGSRTVERAVQQLKEFGADGVISIGGGSPIVAGKGIAMMGNNPGSIIDYEGWDQAPNLSLPLIACPTTAGTGSEVSQMVPIVHEEHQHKMGLGGPKYFPRTAILDPLLVAKLPTRQAALTGIDGLAHGIEAYFTTLTTPITDALALAGIKLIAANLRQAALTDDLAAKEACLVGSSLTNLACGNAKLGLTHAITHPLSGLWAMPHAVAITIMLPYIMEFNMPAAVGRFADIAIALGAEPSGDARSLAHQSVAELRRLIADLGLPDRLTDPPVPVTSINDMARRCMEGMYDKFDLHREIPANATVNSPNVRKATLRDVIGLYERAFEGSHVPVAV